MDDHPRQVGETCSATLPGGRAGRLDGRLFNCLPPNLFRPFTSKYRQTYAAILQRLHQGLLSLDAPGSPTRDAVMGEIEEGHGRAGRHPGGRTPERLSGL